MKLNNKSKSLETNVEGSSLSFGIQNTGAIIEILRNRLYSHPIQTLVQEYLCNARDATREASDGKRIVVTLPSPTNLVLKIRDYGVGLSPERIEKVFVYYGNSTKTGTNDQTGGFGIGAKSAWSYTDSFTIVSHVDGIVRTYVAHTGKSNEGSLDKLSEAKTNEPNGTEIQISVAAKDLEAFHQAVYRATYFWKDKPEIKSGNEPELYDAAPLAAFQNITVVPQVTFLGLGDRWYLPKIILVVDGIPYKITDSSQDLPPYRKLLEVVGGEGCITAIHVNNGDVEVSATRESLADGEYTAKALTTIFNKARAAILAYQTKKLGSAESASHYLSYYKDLSEVTSFDSAVSYSGKGFTFEVVSGGISKLPVGITLDNYYLKRSYRSRKYVLKTYDRPTNGIHTHTCRFYYLDKPIGKARALDAVKADLALYQSDDYTGTVLACESESMRDVFNALALDLGAIPVSSLKGTERVQREKKEKGVITVHVADYKSGGGIKFESSDVSIAETTYDYVYVSKDNVKALSLVYGLRQLGSSILGSRVVPCAIAPANIKKIEGNSRFTAWEDFKASLSDEQIDALENKLLDTSSLRRFSHYMEKETVVQFEDTTLASAVALAMSKDDGAIEDGLKEELKHITVSESFKAKESIVNKAAKLLETRYPMLTHIAHLRNISEIVWYVNTKHKESIK